MAVWVSNWDVVGEDGEDPNVVNDSKEKGGGEEVSTEDDEEGDKGGGDERFKLEEVTDGQAVSSPVGQGERLAEDESSELVASLLFAHFQEEMD